MSKNTEARYRAMLQQRDQTGPSADLPQYLRDQYQSRSTDGVTSHSAPGYVVRDSHGREVVLVKDDGSIDGPDLQYNEGAERNIRFDPDLGYVIDFENTNQDKWDAGHKKRQRIAMMIIAGAGLAGAAAGGIGAAGSAEGLSLSAAGSGGVGAGNVGAGVTGGFGAAAPAAASGLVGGAGATGGGLAGLGTSGSLLNNLGGANNLVRGAMGLASLGAGSSGGGSGGGNTDAGSIIEQMANANRVNHNTPLGSREWTQGQDGRWTVNDTMDPTEAANFRNVQGMNTDVTGEARRRFAAILAAPPRQRYDRPLGS